MRFQSQINHRETADPQNMAFGEFFYPHTTETDVYLEKYQNLEVGLHDIH